MPAMPPPPWTMEVKEVLIAGNVNHKHGSLFLNGNSVKRRTSNILVINYWTPLSLRDPLAPLRTTKPHWKKYAGGGNGPQLKLWKFQEKVFGSAGKGRTTLEFPCAGSHFTVVLFCWRRRHCLCALFLSLVFYTAHFGHFPSVPEDPTDALSLWMLSKVESWGQSPAVFSVQPLFCGSHP